MTGGTDLKALLASMSPELLAGVFVFVTLPPGSPLPSGVDPVMIFREREGVTLIAPRDEAEAAGLPHTFPSRMITLDVHSSLEAVGFLAAIATRLAAAGMGVNPVAGYFHDHLFVPADRAEDAMEILAAIAAENGSPEASR
ncbi:MAG: ACT domain-containing protein [Hyphomicrobiales bacterium]|nr:ACT domain-containing protein [Hyphomicrobiales bacterium]